MGDTSVPPESAPLRHSGGGLKMAARHIFLALYLHHRSPHLLDRHLTAPHIPAPAPEAWAYTAPEEVADYLWRACRRSNNAFGRLKGTPYPLSKLLYRAHPLPSHLVEAS